MGWRAQLRLDYRLDGDGRTIARDRHEGPLRVLKALHPEGPGICHHVLVHPPGGIVGGDLLQVDVAVERGAHALLTTPGATRFYRSGGEPAWQRVHARVEAGARLEWLPLETIAHSGCDAHNRLRFRLAPGAEMIGWDLLALGLPHADAPFVAGRYRHDLALPGAWIERADIDAADRRLLDSPLGFDGRRALALVWFAAGAPIDPARRDALLDAARAAIDASEVAAGATAPNPQVVAVRALSAQVEPLMRLATAVRAAWRGDAWDLGACVPRVWGM